MDTTYRSIYSEVCRQCSELITKKYSTSFSMGIRVFNKEFRPPIYSIYGFVRFADEIVDTFHDNDKKYLLSKFKNDTHEAIDQKISLNPVLESFQCVVNEYNIDKDLIDAFLDSMEMDLYDLDYNNELFTKYIYGSAEVVGLMCLKVFCKNNSFQYESLKASACALGSAFQKVNFLRDMKSDFNFRGRTYFPDVDYNSFSDVQKKAIEKDIDEDFDKAYQGIINLPQGAKLGVYSAYKYYRALFNKIKAKSVKDVKSQRIRINNSKKVLLLGTSALKTRLNLL